MFGDINARPMLHRKKLDPIAISIYYKIASAAGGTGAYWDLSENAGTRLDTANSAFPLTITGTDATQNGPRGSNDTAFKAGGAAYLYTNRTTGDNLDVPATGVNQKYCLFGFIYFITFTTSKMVAGVYNDGSSAPQNMGPFLWDSNSGGSSISGYIGDTQTNSYVSVDIAIPSAASWHFYCTWRDAVDGKIRLAIDGGTPVVTTATAIGQTNNISFFLGGNSGGSYYSNTAFSRMGYIKGDFLTPAEQTWLTNAGLGRNWNEIKKLAGF